MTINNIYIFNKKKKIFLKNKLKANYNNTKAYNVLENKNFLINKNNSHTFNQAAVLCLLQPDRKLNSYNLILTLRSKKLKIHPGEVSFPGGKLEGSDKKSHIYCAFREAKEEININPLNCSYIGKLNKYLTSSGYIIQPIIAISKKNQKFKTDKKEVTEILLFPISYILSNTKIKKIYYTKNGEKRYYFSIEWNKFNIWGATAKILIDLINILKSYD